MILIWVIELSNWVWFEWMILIRVTDQSDWLEWSEWLIWVIDINMSDLVRWFEKMSLIRLIDLSDYLDGLQWFVNLWVVRKYLRYDLQWVFIQYPLCNWLTEF